MSFRPRLPGRRIRGVAGGILQGYLFARPMDAAALAGFLRAHAAATGTAA